jgi:hypothetical protein
VVRRDLLLAARQRADVTNTLLFFLVVVTMVPLGVGPETDTLRRIAPGIIWVAALLAALLSFGRLFANDHRRRHPRADAADRRTAGAHRAGQVRGSLAGDRPADHHHVGAARGHVRPACGQHRHHGGIARSWAPRRCR